MKIAKHSHTLYNIDAKILNCVAKKNTSSVICSNLYCRRNSSDFSCSGVSGAPMEGTICEPGKLCRYGICIDDPSASTKECPFGDDKISINYQSLFTGISFPSSLINCSQLFGLIAAKNQSISGYCELKDVQKLCCQSCQSELLVCFFCSQFDHQGCRF